ncbi:MAG: copper amine oxidase N-terminal domain-containing protein [Clostridiales bacterium]|nr:copper amine oxidase N-terminal domain-containing protein [Clostridiales bacterium]
MKVTFSARFALLALTTFVAGSLLSLAITARATDALASAGSTPGSAADPLVTQAWVEDYVNNQFAPLMQRLEEIAQQLAPSIVLTIDSRQAIINGKKTEIAVAPRIMGAGYTMVPARFIGEALGLNVEWDEASRKVSFSGQGRDVTLTIGSTGAYINGQPYAMPFAPLIIEGRTLVHVRFVSEAFLCKVDWEGNTRRVIITR